MITNESIHKVRERADIIDIIGHFIGLKKRGSNYIANCPFHNEKSPSFNVNPSRGIYKCFGCGEAGDAIQFVQSYEKFTFIESIKWIADFYNMDIEETEANPDIIVHKQKEESLRIVFDFAAKYFHKNLKETASGKAIGLSYFRERGFNDDVIEDFQLGYAMDDWGAFYQEALNHGFQKEILLEAGLVAEKNDKVYDTYRGRIIFPIISNTGKTVGLGGRILNSQLKAPKYINSQESPIYNKSKLLYGLYQGRNDIKKLDECILVEGYTDVISMYQNGVRNVVASSGTALTEGQLKLIKNLTKNLIILYDGDNAGIKAAIRGMQLATKESFNVAIVLLPNNEDPDSYIKNNSREIFLDYLNKNKKDIIDFQIDVAYKDQRHLDAQALIQLTHDLAESIAQIDVINDFILKNVYIKKASERLKINEPEFLQLVNKYTLDKTKKEQSQYSSQNTPTADEFEIEYYFDEEYGMEMPVQKTVPAHQQNNVENRHYRSIIEILLKHGDKIYEDGKKVFEAFFERFELDDISTPLYKSILVSLQSMFNNGESIDNIVLKMIRHDDVQVRNICIELLLEAQKPHPIWEMGNNDNPYLDKSNVIDDSHVPFCKSVFSYYEFHLLAQLTQQVQDQLKDPSLPLADQMVYLKVLDDIKKKQKALGSIVVKK